MHVHPEPQNIALLGTGVFAGVITYVEMGFATGGRILMTERWGHRDTGKEHVVGGRAGTNAPETENPRDVGPPPTLRGGKEGLSPRNLQRGPILPTLSPRN